MFKNKTKQKQEMKNCIYNNHTFVRVLIMFCKNLYIFYK